MPRRVTPPCQLLTGPSFGELQSRVFDAVSEAAAQGPESILYIENNDHRQDQIADSWADEYRPLRLRVTDFNTVVGDCYERISGPGTLLDALTRRRLIDRALRNVAADGLLDDAHLYRDQFTDLFTELESEGYDSPAAVRDLVEESDLPSTAGNLLTTAYQEFHDLRSDGTSDSVYTLSEAYSGVLESDTAVTELLPHTDVVVVSGFYELSRHQEAFLDWLKEELPLYVVLPLVETDGVTAGANEIVAEAVSTYRDLGCNFEPSKADSSTPLVDAAGRMYTATGTPTEADVDTDQLRWYSAPTPDREVRQVATRIRRQLADGIDPNDILVVVPGLISYQEQITDVFDAAGIESIGFANKLLYQTYAGRAMLDLVELCVNEPRTDIVARLATNPVVTLGETRSATIGSTIADLTRRLPTLDVERLLIELDAESREALEHLLDVTDAAGQTEDETAVEAVRDVFEAVDLEENLDTIEENAETFDARMEVESYEHVDRVLDAIESVSTEFGTDDPVEKIQDALEKVRVRPPKQSGKDVVEVVGPRDAFMKSYSHLYFVGLTEADFPVEQDRPRFFETMFDALPGISETDDRREARYQFATLLSSAESVYITTPETSFDDEDLLESSILDELARVTGLEPTEDDVGTGLVEDVQRALRHHREPDRREEAVDHAVDTGAFDFLQAERLMAGSECAANRAATEVTAHDGQLDAATLDELHSSDVRAPYSPTQLRDYAECGFAYYMNRVLGIEAPDEFHVEPQKVDLGRLVHDVLETFYRSFQTDRGEPVHLNDYDRDELERRLLECTLDCLDDAGFAFDDVFYDRWLEQLLAGLATPDENDHYGDERPHRGVDRGLFLRFLDAERDGNDDVPTWFEVPMDFSDDEDGSVEVTTPDGRDIPITGRIDRIGTRESDDGGIEGIVHDYKTSNPSQIRTIDGVRFQLPLYTLAARAHLAARPDEASEEVDGQFYVVEPPTDVTRKWSLEYYLERNDGTDRDYERFLTEVVPDRVGDIVQGIEDGAFQTTVLPAEEAGCRYCDYQDVCDVRHHQRQAAIQEMDGRGTAGYIPQRARDGSFLDTLGGDDE